MILISCQGRFDLSCHNNILFMLLKQFWDSVNEICMIDRSLIFALVAPILPDYFWFSFLIQLFDPI